MVRVSVMPILGGLLRVALGMLVAVVLSSVDLGVPVMLPRVGPGVVVVTVAGGLGMPVVFAMTYLVVPVAVVPSSNDLSVAVVPIVVSLGMPMVSAMTCLVVLVVSIAVVRVAGGMVVVAGELLHCPVVVVSERRVERDMQPGPELDAQQPNERRDDGGGRVARQSEQAVEQGAAHGGEPMEGEDSGRFGGSATALGLHTRFPREWIDRCVVRRAHPREAARNRHYHEASNRARPYLVPLPSMDRAKLSGAVRRCGWMVVGLAVGLTGPGLVRAAEPSETAEVDGAAPIETEASEPALDDAEADDSGGDDPQTRVITVPTTTGDGLTATSHRIDAATLSTTPRRTAEDLMRLVPGMLVVQHGNQGKGYQYYIRGFDAVHGADVEVLVDDVPMNEPSNVHAHGYLDMSFIVPEVVQGLEVKKGSVRLEQGPFATAGSVEYQLGVPAAMRGTTVGYEFGSTGRHRATLVHAPRSRGEQTFVAASAFHDDGYGQNRQAEGVSTLGKARLWSGKGAFVDALGGLYAARFGLPGTLRLDDVKSGRVGFYDAYLHDTAGESARALAAVQAGVKRDRGRLTLTGYAKARRLHLDENFTGFLQSTRPDADVDVNPEWGDRHIQRQAATAAGLRLDGRIAVHERVNLRLVGHYEGGVVDQSNDLVTPQGATWNVDRDLLIEQHGFGLGPGVQWQATPWLRVEGGLRAEGYHARVRDRVRDDATFSGTAWTLAPRLAAQALVGSRWQLFAAYGRGFRPPEARAFTLPQQVPEGEDLDRYRGGQRTMTVADNGEAGARFRAGELLDVGAAVFGTFIARESIFDHVSGFNIELGATRRLGFEADVQVRPTSWLGMGASLVGSHARFVQTGAPVPGAPPLIAQFNGTLLHPRGYRAGLRGLVMGRRPLSYGATAGSLATVDASVGYQWRWLQADLYVDNLLGARWRDGEYHYASYWDRDAPRQGIPTIHYVAGPPRMVRLAASVRF